LLNREGTNEEITDYMSCVNDHDEVPSNTSSRIAPLRRKAISAIGGDAKKQARESAKGVGSGVRFFV
jgi:hypothetical protein